MTFDEFLTRHEACGEALTWKGNRDFAATWNECQRPEWMLWILERVPCDQSKLRLLACDFVRHTPLADGRKVWDLLTDERSRNAVEVAERYAVGKATDEELAAARSAAGDAARAAARAAARSAAGDAARAAARAAANAAAFAAANAAAFAAANAAAFAAAGAAARDAARAAARAAQCDMVRARFAADEIDRLVDTVGTNTSSSTDDDAFNTTIHVYK